MKIEIILKTYEFELQVKKKPRFIKISKTLKYALVKICYILYFIKEMLINNIMKIDKLIFIIVFSKEKKDKYNKNTKNHRNAKQVFKHIMFLIFKNHNIDDE